MPPLRLGIIGVGFIARTAHLPALRPLVEAGEATVAALCDKDRESAARVADEFLGANTYDDHHAMVDQEELDALFVLIPPTFHTDEELLAAEKGIPILVEKPQTLDLAQAVRFEAAIRESGIISTVGFMSRYAPAAERMRERVAELTPRHANLQLFYSGKPIRHWTNRTELCGGSFVENSIHMVDLLRYLLDDDYEQVSAFYFERPPDPDPKAINLPYVYNVNYRFRSGIVANVTTSRVLTDTTARRWELVVVCDDTLLEYSGGRIIENGEVLWETDEDIDPFAVQVQKFLAAVRVGDPKIVKNSYSSALNSLAAVLGANASAERDGEALSIPDLLSSHGQEKR